MSWSASAYPPRRSPSRSPRNATGPRPCSPPSNVADKPHSDWDSYNDRERAWAQYERDRVAYDYGGRRGRSRSPLPDDVRKRPRGRSPSPYDRGRYEPRPRYGDDYDTHSRGYGYGSPRRGQYPPSYPPSGRRPPADPHTLDYPASLKHYAEWFRYHYPQQAAEEDAADKAAEQEAGDGSKPRNGIKSRWEKYKKEFAASQLQTMFDHHRKSAWFAEKYDPSPDFVQLRQRVRKEGWKGRQEVFLRDLEAGKFDPSQQESTEQPASESGADAKAEATGADVDAVNGTAASAGNEGDDKPAAETEEGAPAPSDTKPKDPDEEMAFVGEGDEEDQDANRNESNDKAPSKNDKNTSGEEVSVMPEGNQVMIRTIPPDIGRIKLEEACKNIPGFIYLALGDPVQKRNFYRAGWLRFGDDADMPAVLTELSEKKIEGFKLHVSHNTRPFTSRTRYAPEVASKPDRLAKDLTNAKRLASALEEEAATLRTLKFKPKPEAETAQPPVEGDAPMEDPVPPQDDQTEDVDPEPSENGSAAVERRVEKLMEIAIEQKLVDVSDEKAVEAHRTVVALDLYLAYLRAAFHTCYYCAVVTDHLEELQRKCLRHVRKPLTKLLLDEIKAAETEKTEPKAETEGEENKQQPEQQQQQDEKEKENPPPAKEKSATEGRDWKRNDERWLDWLDSKVALLIDRKAVDPREYGGKNYDEELSKVVEPYIKQEDEGKFRCKTCQKLFKATSFVEKHIANKHPELVTVLEEIPYFNNFALDPHHIQPFTHPPPATTNSQPLPMQAYGFHAPPMPYGGDYARPGGYYGAMPFMQGYPPPPPYAAGYWDPYAYAGAYPPYRRDEATTARRLSDRISGYAPGYDGPGDTLPSGTGLPPKPVSGLDMELTSRRGGGGAGGGRNGGPPPPPPPDAKEDPRAAVGRRVSYHDMDNVAEGDVELTY